MIPVWKAIKTGTSVASAPEYEGYVNDTHRFTASKHVGGWWLRDCLKRGAFTHPPREDVVRPTRYPIVYPTLEEAQAAAENSLKGDQ